MFQFAVALPWWGYALAFAAAFALAWLAYANVAVRLTRPERLLLTGLRAATLLLIVFFLLRPVRVVPVEGAGDSVVAILVDGSRSMRLADAGAPRIDLARGIVQAIQPQIAASFQTELLTFGESVSRIELGQLAADARRSDLTGALSSLANRYRGRRLAAVVVVSDGGDTARVEADAPAPGVPVFAVGVGATSVARDQEIVNFTAGEPLLTNSSIDLAVSATSSGADGAPIELRLSEDGRPIETRRATPARDGAPVYEVFTVSPPQDRAVVYTIEIPPHPDELVAENNARRVLVPPQGRRRRVLVVEGAPGFEHTFLKRALARDVALDVDAVVRKGQNDQGRDTFFIQAGGGRAAALASGYPTRRADLFAYDAVLFGNIEGDFFSRDQLAMTADFVATRGGGLLVFGARSFERATLAGTPLEEVLPVDLSNRRVSMPATAGVAPPKANTAAVTTDGATHPATRIAVSVDESRKRWEQLPALASVSVAGAPRPGAQVLAATGDALGGWQPLIVTQRYGTGRAMVFAGEASWRWRMMRPATDTAHETIWRQLTRWVASGAVDPIEIPALSGALPGTTEPISVLVRDEEFRPVANAEVMVHVREPGGQERTLAAALSDPVQGRYVAAVRFEQAGVHTITADVRRGSEALGSATRPALVGGVDVELAEPRLNEPVLRRIAETSGGRYVPASAAADLPGLLAQSEAGEGPTETRDLWHNGISLAAIIALLALEWLARRRVGLA